MEQSLSFYFWTLLTAQSRPCSKWTCAHHQNHLLKISSPSKHLSTSARMYLEGAVQERGLAPFHHDVPHLHLQRPNALLLAHPAGLQSSCQAKSVGQNTRSATKGHHRAQRPQLALF